MRAALLYVTRLALFTVVVLALLVAFHRQILLLLGVSLDTGIGRPIQPTVPAGFRAGVFASGLDAPRFMAVAPDGTLLVAERGRDRIVALPDANGDGVADRTDVLGTGYGAAHSLAFEADGALLVAGTTSLWRVSLAGMREAARQEVLDGLPDGGHTTKTILVRRDGSLLLSVGSSCNVCVEADERRAAVLAVDADTGTARLYMRGLRNAVGLGEDPATGRAWATVNGRDLLGDDLPPETLYEVVDGGDAGWPRCHAGTLVDPEFGTTAGPAGTSGCAGVAHPAATFTAHTAPLGIAFWRDHAVIAFHGSWNRTTKAGYEVLWLPWSGEPAGPAEVLATGWLDAASGDASGRPAGVTVGGDGALYVSDDKAGLVYRIEGP